MPIYGQIQSHELYNVLVTVTRYFGGVKLGVGGLISAYKTAAQLALESAEIIEKTIEKTFTLTFDYAQMNKVMRIIKEKNIFINNQNLTENCQLTVTISMQHAQAFSSWFADVFPAIKISD
jgi:putative IMPACT (imprinted ancient) family translation regulator